METLSTSASTFELTEPEDGPSGRLLLGDRDAIEVASFQSAPIAVEDRAGSRWSTPNEAVRTAIASAVAAYLATERDERQERSSIAAWAESAILHDLRGSGPWPAGLTGWLEADRPR
jgi:hypothetical protein